jgi:hypothetical protein
LEEQVQGYCFIEFSLYDNDERLRVFKVKRKAKICKIESSGNNLRNGFTLRELQYVGSSYRHQQIDKDEVIPSFRYMEQQMISYLTIMIIPSRCPIDQQDADG